MAYFTGKSLNVQVYQSHMEDLQPEDLERIPLMIIAGPRRKFSSAEFAALQTFRDRGISLLFLLGEGGQDDLPTNINAFLSQSSTGLSFASDRVLRRAWLKYFHPKQAVINDGLLEDSPLLFLENRLEFIYPFGCTIEVGMAESAIPLLTTGQCCYPTGRPICAMSLPSSVNGGKTLCFGSLFAFHDQFLDKEENTKLLIALMGICLTPSEILRKNYPRMPKAEDIPDRPPRQSISRLRMRPTPVVENVFRSFSLDAYCEGMKDVGFEDLASQIQLEVEIERVAEELNVSWDSSQAIVMTPLEGYLPDLEVPIFDPEPRIPGEPTLPLFDLDEDLVSWEERLEQLASEGIHSEFCLHFHQKIKLKNGKKGAASARGRPSFLKIKHSVAFSFLLNQRF
jgi:intraflagellar transport protein 52